MPRNHIWPAKLRALVWLPATHLGRVGRRRPGKGRTFSALSGKRVSCGLGNRSRRGSCCSRGANVDHSTIRAKSVCSAAPVFALLVLADTLALVCNSGICSCLGIKTRKDRETGEEADHSSEASEWSCLQLPFFFGQAKKFTQPMEQLPRIQGMHASVVYLYCLVCQGAEATSAARLAIA